MINGNKVDINIKLVDNYCKKLLLVISDFYVNKPFLVRNCAYKDN